MLSYAETIEDKAVAVVLSADRETIMPCEPLGLVVILTNRSTRAVEKVSNQWTSYRIKKDGDQGWRTYMAYGPQPTPTLPMTLVLMLGQQFSDFCLVHVDMKGEPVFKDRGVYYVQAGTPFGESNVIKIKVDLPESSSSSALTVYSKKLYMLFDDYSIRCYVDAGGNLEFIENSLDEFKRSTSSVSYSAWITVAEFFLRKVKIYHESETKQLVLLDNLISEYEKVVTKLPSPQKEILMIAIAEVRIFQSQKNAAIRILQDVIQDVHTGNYFKVKAQYLRSLCGEM
jgi:hypothetical protein